MEKFLRFSTLLGGLGSWGQFSSFIAHMADEDVAALVVDYSSGLRLLVLLVMHLALCSDVAGPFSSALELHLEICTLFLRAPCIVIFRAPPAMPELSASFSSFRALTTVSARGPMVPESLGVYSQVTRHRVVPIKPYGGVDISIAVSSICVNNNNNNNNNSNNNNKPPHSNSCLRPSFV